MTKKNWEDLNTYGGNKLFIGDKKKLELCIEKLLADQRKELIEKCIEKTKSLIIPGIADEDVYSINEIVDQLNKLK